MSSGANTLIRDTMAARGVLRARVQNAEHPVRDEAVDQLRSAIDRLRGYVVRRAIDLDAGHRARAVEADERLVDLGRRGGNDDDLTPQLLG